jgi:hypothetical protein
MVYVVQVINYQHIFNPLCFIGTPANPKFDSYSVGHEGHFTDQQTSSSGTSYNAVQEDKTETVNCRVAVKENSHGMQ